MLQVIRDRASGFFVWTIVGLIIITFAFVGLNSYFDDTDAGYQAALVNDQKVTVNEYQIAYSNEQRRIQQMFGENFDPDMFDDQIKKTALDRVIDTAIIVQQAEKLGMRISDEQLARQVQNINQFMEDGKFSQAVYQQTLEQAGESVAGFEYRVRRSLMADQLVNGIIQSSFATKDEIELTHRLREQAREVAYVSIPLDPFKEKVQVTDDEIAAYYNENKDRFKTAEQVKLDYLELSVDSLMDSMTVDEDELESYYEEQKDRFITPEERRASHILIEFGDDADKAKAKADSVYEKIKAGESFEKLAKEYSDDIGSAAEGGDLGYFAKGIMDANFEDTAFSMNVGEVSKPVRSEFGYHIIKLVDIKASEGKSLADVRDEIEAEIKKQKAEKAYFDKVELLANIAYETPDSLEPAKEELGLKIKTTGYISKRGGPGIFSNRKVIDAAFSDDVLKENLNSEAIELNNRTIVLRLNDYKPAQAKPLEEVSAQIKATLINDKALEMAKQDAKVIEDKLKAGTSGADAVAVNDKTYTWHDKKWIKRDEADVPREIVQTAFTLPRLLESEKISTKGVKLNNGEYALVVFSGIKDGDVSTMTAEERKQIGDGIANAVGVDIFTTMLKALKDEAVIERFPENL